MIAPGPEPLDGSVKEEPGDDDDAGDHAIPTSSPHDDGAADVDTRKGPKPNILDKKPLTRRES